MLRKILVLAPLVIALSSGVMAESYGDPLLDPIPNVTNIEIYNVTGEQDKLNDGELQDSGLNRTFRLNQSEPTEYRFTFEIVNDGGDDWDIDEEDNLLHRGLNSSWSIDPDNVVFNVSGEQYSGGTFSDNTLEWDTSNDGSADLSTDETMWAKYVVEIEQDESRLFEQEFEVNNSNTDSGSRDEHELDITKLGELIMNLIEPPNDTVVTVNQSFLMNGSATCEGGVCGEVEMSPRYNESDTADTLIPEDDTSEPFNTNSSNTKTCSDFLSRDETCYTNWFVNASGEEESYHLLDVKGSSNETLIADEDSTDNLVQINSALIIDLNWKSIGFGNLDSGESSPAENNNEGYNITVDEESNPIDELWVRGTELVSQRFPDEYSIGVGNVSYSKENDESSSENLTEEYSLLETGLAAGDILSTYYWIDVPNGITFGGYNGTIEFKANSS